MISLIKLQEKTVEKMEENSEIKIKNVNIQDKKEDTKGTAQQLFSGQWTMEDSF